MSSSSAHPKGCASGRRPRLQVATVFREHGESYRRTHTLGADQLRAMHAIERCRTAALGGHVDRCSACGDTRPSYNSCRNRHCPTCQSLSQAKWLEQRKRRILPTHYFHVVFTLPSELRPLALRNRTLVYDALFRAAASTVLELSRDEKRLGAVPGLTCVLHTWSRTLAYHPHVHCIVTGGGLSLDHRVWVASRRGFLFPVQVMARLFRGKMLAALHRALRNRTLRLPERLDPSLVEALLHDLHRRAWVVYAKPPFGGPEHVYAYLGRYTHRVGISDARLRSIDDESVVFVTKHRKTTKVHPSELIRRMLQHVLPRDFVKLRHYGLLSPRHATSLLEHARTLLGGEPPPPVDDLSWRERFFRLTGIDLRICPRCGERTVMRVTELLRPDRAHHPIVEDLDTS